MHHVQLFVPSLDKQGELISIRSRDHVITLLSERLLNAGGGFTRQWGMGTYRMESGDVQTEPVDNFSSFVTSAASMQDIARFVAQKLDQESVLLVVDGKPEFITQRAELSAAV